MCLKFRKERKSKPQENISKKSKISKDKNVFLYSCDNLNKKARLKAHILSAEKCFHNHQSVSENTVVAIGLVKFLTYSIAFYMVKHLTT